MRCEGVSGEGRGERGKWQEGERNRGGIGEKEIYLPRG